jgi:hypothetical protein
MGGRWASAALGAGLARRQASYEMDQQSQAYEPGIITEEEFQKLK